MSGFGSRSDPIETERSMLSLTGRGSVRKGFPDDASRVEHRTVEARTNEVRRSAGLPGQDDAAVAAAEAAAHDLFERHIARRAVEFGNCRNRAHHGRRPAHIQLHGLAWTQRFERVAERHGDESFAAATPVFG